MRYPVPRPKSITYTGKTVPASFTAENFDLTFEPALRVFRSYAQRAFGNAVDNGGSFSLVLEPDLGIGYRISIGEKTVLAAANNTGMNYALATLLQLATVTDNGVVFPCCEIADSPDNTWRGVMLDLARCYHEIEYLYAVADLCWFYKISRYQLHLTDDQGVRFPFVTVPNAVSREHYSREQLSGLIEYCKDRGITIVPEVDAPGHFSCFNKAYPNLFGTVPENSNVMRMQEEALDILQSIFSEVADFFADSPWIHIGGDEANVTRWETCRESSAYRKAHGLKDVHELYGHCVARISQMILDMGRTPVVWEGFSEQCNHMIPKQTLVFTWESYYQTAPKLLNDGFSIINASWLPLYIVNPSTMWDPEVILDWEKNIWQHWWIKSAAYETPIVVPQDSNIVGGQICVWGDSMKPDNAYAPHYDMLHDEFANLRIRVPALAQKVWTSYNSPDKQAFMADLSALDQLLIKLLQK